MSEYKPANHELAKQVQKAVIKIVAGLIVVCVLPAVAVIYTIVSNGKPIEIGNHVPEFVLFNQHHQRVSNRDLEGGWSFVYFYPGDGIAESQAQAKYFRDHYSNFSQLHVRLVGISYDAEETHSSFSSELELEHDLLSDPDGYVIEDFSAHTSMHYRAKNIGYLVDDHGAIRKVYLDLEPSSQLEQLSRDVHALINS